MAAPLEHQPVMLQQVLEGLALRQDGIYVDATFGRGGHAGAILERLGPEGRLLAMDKDPEAVQAALARFGSDPRFHIEHGSFSMLGDMAQRHGITGRTQGVLFDLGVSSPQLGDAGRGFSFLADGPLDMRMDPTAGPSAADWLATASESEIADVIHHFGEERFARRIARAIVAARTEAPLTRTGQLADLVARAVPTRERNKHPATRTFQAIRIFVNQELDDLQQGLAAAVEVLAPGGRLLVISFHSLEDRLVKRFMRRESRGEPLPREIPVTGTPVAGRLRVIGRARKPANDEIQANPRARSAVLRVAERAA